MSTVRSVLFKTLQKGRFWQKNKTATAATTTTAAAAATTTTTSVEFGDAVPNGLLPIAAGRTTNDEMCGMRPIPSHVRVRRACKSPRRRARRQTDRERPLLSLHGKGPSFERMPIYSRLYSPSVWTPPSNFATREIVYTASADDDNNNNNNDKRRHRSRFQ